MSSIYTSDNYLDLQNHLFMLTLDGKLYLAPIGDKIQNVLDVGTGTGIWAIDFGSYVPVSHKPHN